MQPFLERHQGIKDVLGIIGFVAAVIIGAALINQFLFRSFSVSGPSMEPTLYTGDRLIVNRVPVTIDQIQGKPYVPERGQIIVFKNPHWMPGGLDEFIVKRVVAYPGERVTVQDGVMKVYSASDPAGFVFDDRYPGGTSPTAGAVDVIVPDNELFVAGDHRQEGFSLDSRDGLGTIPYEDLIGPVSMRVYPFTGFKIY
ncbi:MAG TPA: signal peptidase I [Candidatus Saccharibacteria bacterium]|mgnify:FL=1|nr:signal peptidase I [Candidatus Saccharibacteria bacterium]